MSPYMKAYEAGVKLAKVHWASKYANEEDDEPMPTEGYEFSDEEVARISQQLDDASQFGAPSMARGDQSSSMSLDGIDPRLLAFASRLQEAPADAQAGQAAAQQAAAQQAAALPPPTAAPIEEDPLERAEREQEELARNTFNVQAGGYGKQLARFRDQFGEGNEELFTGDNAVDYRDFARAMDNRGLQVGDTFDARSVLNNLRAMRQPEAVENPLTASRVNVQRGGRDARFQTMQQQRAAANRRSAANRRASSAPLLETLNTTSVGPQRAESLQGLTSGLAQQMGGGYEFAQQPLESRQVATRGLVQEMGGGNPFAQPPTPLAPRRPAPRRPAPRRPVNLDAQKNIRITRNVPGGRVIEERRGMTGPQARQEAALNQGQLGSERQNETARGRQGGMFAQMSSLLQN